METIATPVQIIMYRIYLRLLDHEVTNSFENIMRDFYNFTQKFTNRSYHEFRACVLASIADDTPLPTDIERAAFRFFTDDYKQAPADAENKIRRHAQDLLDKFDRINKQYAEQVRILKKSTLCSDILRAHWLNDYFRVIVPEINKRIQHGMIYKLGYIEGIRAERARRRNSR